MAPTDFDYFATRNEIIQGALEIVGAVEAEQAPNAAMFNQALGVLQRMAKAWSNENLYLWDWITDSFVTVADQELYDNTDFDASFIGLDKAWIVDSSEDIPLEVIPYTRYVDVYDKETNTGRPVSIAFRVGAGGNEMYLWPSPDAVYTIKVAGPSALKDFESAASASDVLARFQEALEYGLADRLFDRYPGPMNEREWVHRKATETLYKAKSFKTVNEDDEVEGFYGRRR